jgi:arylsulfatase
METIDDETTAAAIDFITRAGEAGSRSSLDEHHAHARFTHVARVDAGKSGMPATSTRDGMLEHDATSASS